MPNPRRFIRFSPEVAKLSRFQVFFFFVLFLKKTLFLYLSFSFSFSFSFFFFFVSFVFPLLLGGAACSFFVLSLCGVPVFPLPPSGGAAFSCVFCWVVLLGFFFPFFKFFIFFFFFFAFCFFVFLTFLSVFSHFGFF